MVLQEFTSCVARKLVLFFSGGTLVPHVDFQVQPAWIWNLLSGGKMRREAARLEFVKQARGLPRLFAAFGKFVNENAAAELAAKIACVHAEVALARRPFRRLPVVDAWVALRATTRWRYPFLVLTGPSCMGKTQYALFLVAACRALDLNMACAVEPDLRTYNPAAHDLILFDEMSVQAVLWQKKMMQAPACMLGLGSSPTTNVAYAVWIHAKLLVVCTNRWDVEVKAVPHADREWLAANSVVVRVDEPLFVA